MIRKKKLENLKNPVFFKNLGKNESFIYFLDSGVKNELNKVKTCQNVDFSVQIDLFDPHSGASAGHEYFWKSPKSAKNDPKIVFLGGFLRCFHLEKRNPVEVTP